MPQMFKAQKGRLADLCLSCRCNKESFVTGEVEGVGGKIWEELTGEIFHKIAGNQVFEIWG